MRLTVREKRVLRFCIAIARQLFENNAEAKLFQRLEPSKVPSMEEFEDLDLRLYSSIEHDHRRRRDETN